jgi:hypothetical protein
VSKMKLISIVKQECGDTLLTFERPRNFFLRLIGFKSIIKQYIGGETTWYNFPWFIRCDQNTEIELINVWNKLKHEGRV